jgi:hypothetical protein
VIFMSRVLLSFAVIVSIFSSCAVVPVRLRTSSSLEEVRDSRPQPWEGRASQLSRRQADRGVIR